MFTVRSSFGGPGGSGNENGLVINTFEGTVEAPLNPDPTVDNPGRVQPYVDTFSIGYQREQWQGVSWGVDLIRAQNRDTLVTADLNPFSVAAGGRPELAILDGEPIDTNSITTFVNAGESDYSALQLSLHRRFDGRWGGRISGTFGDTEGNHEGGGGNVASAYFQTRTEPGYNFDTGQVLDAPLQLNMNDPRTSDVPLRWQRDDHIVVSGQYLVPGTSWRENDGLIIAGIYRYLSGDKFTAFHNSRRLDNNNRDVADPGTYGADTDLGPPFTARRAGPLGQGRGGPVGRRLAPAVG